MHPQQVIDFWIDDVGENGWYDQDDALDQTIRDRFLNVWEKAQAHELQGWQSDARTVLAFLIVTDQFSRNMFRGDPRAFSTDEMARAAAKHAVDLDWDLKIAEPERQFFYLPLMHSECLTDQDRCVRLMLTRMPETGASNLLHARVHREIIRRFGRFPYRNDALSRETTKEEAQFLAQGGYGAIVREMQEAA